MKKLFVAVICVVALGICTVGGSVLSLEDKPSITSIKPVSKFL